jgi:hypothetical protein
MEERVIAFIVLIALCVMFYTVIVYTYKCIESIEFFDAQCNHELVEYLKQKRV